MKELVGVLNSDSLNRSGTRFTVSALVAGLWATHDVGMPLLISHDFQRPIGWQYPFAIHFEPGLTRLAGLGLMVDNDAEADQLSNALSSHLIRELGKHEADITELRSLLGEQLRGGEKIVPGKEALAFMEPGLCERMFPDVFAHVDKDGLVPLKDLDAIGPGVFRIGKLAIFAHSFFRRSLSRLNTLNVPFLARLQAISEPEVSVRIAIDADAVGLASTYAAYEELEYWWGPKFDDDLSNIQVGVSHHEASKQDRIFHGISGSQFWWQSRGGKHIFETEELRDIPSFVPAGTRYGCRYVHSIVDEETGNIDHLDGAVRLYSEDKMIERLPLRLSEAGRHTEYSKLWRLDGVIPLSIWKSLLSDYFRDNRLVGEYFGATDTYQYDFQSTADAENHNWVPYSMHEGDGVRIALSFHEIKDEERPERGVVSLDSFKTESGVTRYVESWVIELEKALKKNGASLSISNEIQFLACKDFYINFPVIEHANGSLPGTVAKTIEAYRQLVSAFRARNYDQVASFTIQFPVEGKDVRISVLGHINDLNDWLTGPLAVPPVSQEGILEWSECVAKFLGDAYKTPDDAPGLAETLMPSGVLLIRRQSLSEKIDIKYEETEIGLKFSLRIPDEESALKDEVARGRLAPALAFLKTETRCTNCHESYRSCPCSKMLETGVAEEIIKVHPIRPFWTDRPLT
jgi:hypothetical protein